MTRGRDFFTVHLRSGANEHAVRKSFRDNAARVAPLFISYSLDGSNLIFIDSSSFGELREGKDRLEMDVTVTYRPLEWANLSLPRGEKSFSLGSNSYYQQNRLLDMVEGFTLCADRFPRFPPKDRLGRIVLSRKEYLIWRK